jgi:hypothetical protein
MWNQSSYPWTSNKEPFDCTAIPSEFWRQAQPRIFQRTNVTTSFYTRSRGLRYTKAPNNFPATFQVLCKQKNIVISMEGNSEMSLWMTYGHTTSYIVKDYFLDHYYCSSSKVYDPIYGKSNVFFLQLGTINNYTKKAISIINTDWF